MHFKAESLEVAKRFRKNKRFVNSWASENYRCFLWELEFFTFFFDLHYFPRKYEDLKSVSINISCILDCHRKLFYLLKLTTWQTSGVDENGTPYRRLKNYPCAKIYTWRFLWTTWIIYLTFKLTKIWVSSLENGWVAASTVVAAKNGRMAF